MDYKTLNHKISEMNCPHELNDVDLFSPALRNTGTKRTIFCTNRRLFTVLLAKDLNSIRTPLYCQDMRTLRLWFVMNTVFLSSVVSF